MVHQPARMMTFFSFPGKAIRMFGGVTGSIDDPGLPFAKRLAVTSLCYRELQASAPWVPETKHLDLEIYCHHRLQEYDLTTYKWSFVNHMLV